MPRSERRLDPIREAACLAHVVPGVSLRLPLANDEHLLVSHVCLGADLDPCQLRSALIADRTHGLRMLTDMICGAEIVSGLVDLGGGLYQRVWPGVAERWFTSTREPDALAETLCSCPAGDVDLHPAGTSDSASCDRCFDIVVKPDEALGLSAVCVRCLDERGMHSLDEVATRALSACLVAELIGDLDGAHR
jgi:hypothetical protein